MKVFRHPGDVVLKWTSGRGSRCLPDTRPSRMGSQEPPPPPPPFNGSPGPGRLLSHHFLLLILLMNTQENSRAQERSKR